MVELAPPPTLFFNIDDSSDFFKVWGEFKDIWSFYAYSSHEMSYPLQNIWETPMIFTCKAVSGLFGMWLEWLESPPGP